MIKNFLNSDDDRILASLVILLVLIIVQIILRKLVKRVAKLGEFDKNRSLLIIRYVNIFFFFLLILAASLIWGVNIKDLGLLMSSIFAVIGVALFASWSILSNITAGIILFFSLPFKIGDTIRIQDKDFPTEATIEDIKAFHIHLRTSDNELLTYPNNLLLQKGVTLVSKLHEDEGSDAL